jgi:hypothetical protein
LARVRELRLKRIEFEKIIAERQALQSHLRTLQRRVKVWRSNRARELVIQILGDTDAMKAGTATRHQPSSRTIGE